jgi:allophanate hydrolase subunit 1
MEIVPLGDSALIVRVRERFEDAPEQTLDTVLRAFQELQGSAIPGVIELAPAYTSVTVFFDPTAVAKATEIPDKVFDWLATRIRAAAAPGADRGRRRRTAQSDVCLVEIPVCYDPEFALDIDNVARRANVSPSEVIQLHSANSRRFCRDRRRTNGNLSAAFPRWLESDRPYAVALVRSRKKSAHTFARRRPGAFPRDHAR